MKLHLKATAAMLTLAAWPPGRLLRSPCRRRQTHSKH